MNRSDAEILMDMPTDLKLAPRENPPSRRPVAAILLIALVAFGLAMPSSAEVERLEITKRRPSPGFAAGLAGPYEFLRGTAHFAVDPAAPENARVVDLDKAERDPDGKVRFTASFYLFQPVDPTRGNGALIVDVPNRGRPLALLFNFPDSTLRPPSGPLGDGFLERHGFAAAGVGWQSDAPELPSAAVASGALLLQRDLVPAGGVEGLARGVGVFSRDGETRLELGHWKHRPILAAAPDDPRNVLTVRDRLDGERRVVPRERWRFSPERDAVLLEDGFEKGKVYEVVYVARDSDIAGLGFVATRDFAAYLVHSPDSPAKVRRTLAFGGSQTARFLRHFLYQGFNGDAQGRRVLDGVFSLVGGGGRGSFNHRFAQPSRANTGHFSSDYPIDLFPFTSLAQKDPVDGLEGGLLSDLPEERIPKLFQVNSGFEAWGRVASLIHTTVDGKADAPLHPSERIYTIASAQHSPAPFPPSAELDMGGFETVRGQLPFNPANYQWVLRALLLRLDAWVLGAEEPPPSRYPRVDAGELVERSRLAWPPIPGVPEPPEPYMARRLDVGPRFADQGILDPQPPRVGAAYGVRVGQVDADGNELGGIRLPEIVVPLATYTAWNRRHPDQGAPEQPALLVGGWIPFPRDAAARSASGDPRPSIAERYAGREEYLGRYVEAAVALAREGYILAEDVAAMVGDAEILWRRAVEPPSADEDRIDSPHDEEQDEPEPRADE